MERTELSIAGSVDISEVSALRERMLAALDAGLPIRLDVSAVERADTAAIQLLCAFASDARRRGLGVEWHEPSDALRRAATLLGLAHVLLTSNGDVAPPPAAA